MPAFTHLVRATAAGLVTIALACTAGPVAPATTLAPNGKPVTNAAGTTFGILSHRGGAGQWPENSAVAYANSVAERFDGIETDIVFTSDGVGVMSHYDVLPTRCTEAGRSIHRMTLAEVALVRCADLTGAKVVPIPTFAELAAILKGHTDVGLTLDIKSYHGQSGAGKRAWASKAIRLVRDAGLLAQTTILTFYWADSLPVIRKYARKVYVLALDNGTIDLDRVRLAARLGADGFGIKMKYTSESFVRYVRAKGMDSVPWEVLGTEFQAFTIAYAGKLRLFSSDMPTETRADLLAGRINLNPVARAATTSLPSPVTISNGTYSANRRHYPRVLKTAVPAADVAMLRNVTLTVTVRAGKGKGKLYVGAMSSPLKSSVTLRLPKGTGTFRIAVPLGDGGKLRIYTTARVKLAVKVVSYTRVRFA